MSEKNIIIMKPKMDNFQSCRLCHGVISANFEKISNFMNEILGIILLKLDFDKNKHGMCKVCSIKVREAFKFKSMCIYTDNTIIPYVDNETGSSVDLLEIYAKEKNIPLMDTLHDRKVCRLCMQLIQGEFMSVDEVETDAIEKYIPEMGSSRQCNPFCNLLYDKPNNPSYFSHQNNNYIIHFVQQVIFVYRENNISIIKDPVVCKQCFDSVGTHSSFIKNCLEVEEKIKSCNGVSGSRSSSSISVSELCIKAEDNIIKEESDEDKDKCIQALKEDEYQIKTECIDIKSEEDGESESSSSIHLIVTQEDHTYCLKDHSLASKRNLFEPEEALSRKTILRFDKSLHKNQLDMEVHTYRTCDYGTGDLQSRLMTNNYKTRCRRNLSRDQLKHKDHSQVTMHKCDMFNYKTKYRFQLTQHQLKHKDHSQVQMYKCEKCTYDTKYKTSLTQHQLIHKDPSQVQMHKCDKCTYETKYKSHLTQHQLLHKDPSQVQMYKCDKCIYKTKYKYYLTQHQLKHKDPSQVTLYKCDTCIYETRYSNALKLHQLVHKNPSQVRMYKCEKCTYETKCKGYLTRHQLVHKDPSQMQMYKCDKCTYKTKYKNQLKLHLLRHKFAPKLLMYKCGMCSYESKLKVCVTQHQIVH